MDSSGYKGEAPPPYAASSSGPAPTMGYPAYPAMQQQPTSSYPPPQQQPTVVVVTQQPAELYGTGGPVVARCPNCQVGYVRLNFTFIGLLWGIFCFPCGLICCLGMRDKRCSHCNYDMN